MIEILLTAIPSLCWMLFRCYQLLQTPAERLARHLNVDIPHTPSVCVDLIGQNAVVVHWDIEIQPDENIFYVILLNGKEAATLAQTSAKLCSLEPDSLYRIQVLSVNALSNFRSQSPAVYIHTLAKTKKTFPFSVEKEVCLPRQVSDLSTTNYSMGLTLEEVDKLDSERALAEYLYLFQNELTRLNKDVRGFTEHQHEEANRLKAELDSFKKELDEESDIRVKKDLNVKDLEKRKDSLTFDRLKLSKQLKNHQSSQSMHLNRLTELKARLSKLVEKHQHALNAADSEKARVLTKVESLHGDIHLIREENASAEEALKALANERRDLVNLVSSLKPLVEQFTLAVPDHSPNASQNSLSTVDVFTREGTLSKMGSDTLRKVFSIKPEWEGDVNKELEALAGLELSWTTGFRAAIGRFLAMQNSLDIARTNEDEGYQPQKMTEYQASIEFGGFSNALPKPTRRRNFEGSSSPSPPPEEFSHYNLIYEGDLGLIGVERDVSFDRSSDFLQSPELNFQPVNSLVHSLQLQQSLQQAFQQNLQNQQYPQNHTQPNTQRSMLQQEYSEYPVPESSLAEYQPYQQEYQDYQFQQDYQPNYQQDSRQEYPQYPGADYRYPAAEYRYPAADYQTQAVQDFQDFQQDYERSSLSRIFAATQPDLTPAQPDLTVRTGFPYDDQVYGLRSPELENSFVHPQPSVWNNQPYYQGISLPPSVHATLALPPLHLLQHSLSESVFNSLLLSNSTLQVASTSIWLERPLTSLLSYRTPGLWGNEASPNLPMSEFQPFTLSIPMRNSTSERRNDDISDIRLL